MRSKRTLRARNENRACEWNMQRTRKKTQKLQTGQIKVQKDWTVEQFSQIHQKRQRHEKQKGRKMARSGHGAQRLNPEVRVPEDREQDLPEEHGHGLGEQGGGDQVSKRCHRETATDRKRAGPGRGEPSLSRPRAASGTPCSAAIFVRKLLEEIPQMRPWPRKTTSQNSGDGDPKQEGKREA